MPDARAAGAAMHHQLGDLGAVRLVRRPRRMQLHGTGDAIGVARDEEHGARSRGAERATPPSVCIGDAQWREEADRGAGINRVNEQLRQRADVVVRRRRTQPFDAARTV